MKPYLKLLFALTIGMSLSGCAALIIGGGTEGAVIASQERSTGSAVDDAAGILNYLRDAWISTQVKARLLFAKNIRSINYSIITVNQTVYMMGIAQDQDELDRATYVASTTDYVQHVTSYVRLKNDPRRGYLPQ